MKVLRLASLSLLLSVAPALAATDPLFLELSAKGDRVDLGLPEFTAASLGELETVAKSLRDVVRSDLLFPRLFKLVEGGPVPDEGQAVLAAWDKLGVDVVAAGHVSEWFGRPQFNAELRDVGTGQALLKKKYTVEPDDPRRAAHEWADEVVKYFSGQAGVARSRIVFVNDAGGRKEICSVDYDGSNFRRLTEDRSIALFPKFSADGKWIVFTSFRDGGPAVHLVRADGGERKVLCRYEGLNSASDWLPDGKSLVATLSLGREPSLHLVDLEGRILRTLTNSAAVDTAPSLSPDGLHLAFTSDRPGRPQIYVMDASGANLRRLTQTDGHCDSPAWSPLGHLVAFTMSEKGKNFDIHTVETATGQARRLTWGEGDNENPAWSPDGRYLVFTSTRRGRPELFVMGFDGSDPRPLADIPGRSFTPDWGR